MNNDITALREELFRTLRELRSGKIDVDIAKVINDTAQVIVNSARVELDHIKVVGGSSRFVPPEHGLEKAGLAAPQVKQTAHGQQTSVAVPGGQVHQHLIGR
jgi:hypothetical protein